MLVIDEAWNLMQHEDSARFLYGLIKRARKYYLGVTTITQDVEDFVNSPYGKAIITNASLNILLKQSPSAIDNLQKLFYLTDGEKYVLLNSDIGQGLFFANNKHVAIQIIASPHEERVITTKPEEVLEMKSKDIKKETTTKGEEIGQMLKAKRKAKKGDDDVVEEAKKSVEPKEKKRKQKDQKKVETPQAKENPLATTPEEEKIIERAEDFPFGEEEKQEEEQK
jgi:ribosomal protein L18